MLGGLTDPQVITDPGGEVSSAWRTYRLCLRSAPEQATHVLVIQDDTTVCEHFTEAAFAAIEKRPASAVCFFLGGQPAFTASHAMQAKKRGEHWVQIANRDFCPTVATAYPREMALALADWVDAVKSHTRGDDSVVGDFFRIRRHEYQAWATVPSLVQHPDDVPSQIGRKHLNGKNPGRVAKLLVEGDPRLIDWTR